MITFKIYIKTADNDIDSNKNNYNHYDNINDNDGESNDDSKWDNVDDHSKKSSSENDNKDLITSTKPGRLWPDSPSEVSCESTRRNCTRNRGSP